MFKKFFLAITLFSIVIQVSSQELKSSNNIPYPFDVKFEQTGWMFAPGITYMLPIRDAEQQIKLGGDTVLNNKASGSGGVGLYFEAGRFKVIKGSKRFQFYDYSLSYKMLRGAEYFDRTITTNNSSLLRQTESRYQDHVISGNINVYNIRQLKEDKFLLNGIGMNADLIFATSREKGDLDLTNSVRVFPNRYYFQLHYKLGFGFRPHKDFIVIPTIETPILTAYPFDGGLSSSHYFYTRHRPFLISVKVLWLKSNLHNCPPVYL